jgi:serine/threonine protein kinase
MTSSSRRFRSAAALVVGIGHYPEGPTSPSAIPFATDDAKAMAALLADPTLCGFDPDQTKLLTDGDATRTNIIAALSSWLHSAAQNADLAIVFLAGHGVLHRYGYGDEGYFLSYDSTLDNVPANGISMRDIASWINAIESSAIVVFLDCCHAGKALLFRDPTVNQAGLVSDAVVRNFGLGSQTSTDFGNRRRFVIAACDETQSSIESPTLRHGLFTYHLLEGLRGAADSDGDGQVDVTELFNYVCEAVTRDAEKLGRSQKPWTQGTWTGKVHLSYLHGVPGTTFPHNHADSVATEDWLKNIEGQLPGASDAVVLSVLESIREQWLLAGVPILFHCLAHPRPTVRLAAKKTLEELRWAPIAEKICQLAEAQDESKMGFVLEGLAAIEARDDVVRLLDSLVTVLKGSLWQRAVFLLERKRLSLTFDDVAELFRDKESPYQLVELLGAGLFTAAYSAKRRSSQLKFVVRVLRPEFAGNPRVRKAFLEISQHSFDFHHPSLVLTRDFGGYPDKSLYYVVRDHIDGPTLRDVLAKGRTFEPAQSVRILKDILGGLRRFHEGVDPALHGGIKPSNIFLARDGRIILGDPSLPVPPPNTELRRLAYDFRYIAPEAFRSFLSGLESQPLMIGPRADYYSIGCVAYELLCGVAPFVAENQYELYAKHARDAFVAPQRHDSRLGPKTTECLGKLLAKRPEERFRSIDEIERALDSLLGDFGEDSHGSDNQPVEPVPKTGGDLMGIAGPPQPGSKPADANVRIMDDASLAGYEPGRTLLSVSITGTLPARMNPLNVHPSIPTRYQVIEQIGAGGMGQVYKARDTALNRIVAIKVLRYPGRAEAARFQTEASATARLAHPGIVGIYDVGTSEGIAYIIMEWIDGPTLSEVLSGRPDLKRAVELVRPVAEALSYAHSQGIVHRDIKPSNILIDHFGHPKICDFGIAKFVETNDVTATSTGQIVGTPAYMSPEQAAGRPGDVGPRTDVYSLGCVLYEAITGSRPFDGYSLELLHRIVHEDPPSPRYLNPAIPADLEVICLKCLQKEPARRYQSAAELADDLRRFGEGEPIEARPVASRRVLRWSRRHPRQIALIAVSAIVGAAIAIAIAQLVR